MNRTIRLLIAILLLSILLPATAGCSQKKTQFHILEAGSLLVPFDAIELEYEALNPDIDILAEGHGSIQVTRHITEIHDLADIAVVADHSLIPLLMYPVDMPDGDGPYADWTISFATNRLGLAYNSQSAHADKINIDNWLEILSMPELRLGFSDPRFDACGYRALMLFMLAENYYEDDTIFENLIANNFWPRITVIKDGDVASIRVPEILEPSNDRYHLRGFSVQLLALLESGDIDYALLYESVARQHGLEFLELPQEIDLSSADCAELYGKVSVKMDFQRFKTISPEYCGQPIVYGITIPGNAPHPEKAAEFIEFLLGEQGKVILEKNYQPALVPPVVDYRDRLPARLAALF